MAYPNYIWVKIRIPEKARLDELQVDQLIRDLTFEAKDVAIDKTYNVDENLQSTLNDKGDEIYRNYGAGKGLVPLVNGKIVVMTMTHEDANDFIHRIEAIAGKYNCEVVDNDVAVNDCDTYWVDDGFPPCR